MGVIADALQARNEAKAAAAQAAVQEAARQKALAMPKANMPRSQKPLTEPKDIEFQTAKRQRVQDAPAPDKVSVKHVLRPSIRLLVSSQPCTARRSAACVAVGAKHCNKQWLGDVNPMLNFVSTLVGCLSDQVLLQLPVIAEQGPAL